MVNKNGTEGVMVNLPSKSLEFPPCLINHFCVSCQKYFLLASMYICMYLFHHRKVYFLLLSQFFHPVHSNVRICKIAYMLAGISCHYLGDRNFFKMALEGRVQTLSLWFSTFVDFYPQRNIWQCLPTVLIIMIITTG